MAPCCSTALARDGKCSCVRWGRVAVGASPERRGATRSARCIAAEPYDEQVHTTMSTSKNETTDESDTEYWIATGHNRSCVHTSAECQYLADANNHRPAHDVEVAWLPVCQGPECDGDEH